MRRVAAFAALVTAFFAFAAAARADTPTILVDGQIVHTDVPAIVDQGRVLVPLRGVLERLGARVDFDSAHNIVVAERSGAAVKVAVNSSDAWVNGRHVALDVPAREFGGRVEVPLRFIAQALGVAVDYDALSNTVVIVSGLKEGNFVAAGPGTPAAEQSAASTQYVTTAEPAPTIDEHRPAPDSLVGSEYPQIYARFASGGSQVDPATVRILVDGSDVTDASTLSSAYVAYTPQSPLYSGTHQVQISGQSVGGTPFDDEWSFRIDSGYSADYVASAIGYSPSFFGVHRFGFFPPGFSVFAPGPQFFVEDEPIVIVFFSPFFPNGTGFFTVPGFPGQFPMTPWLGCPGFFFSTLTVPFGINDPDAVIAAHFTTAGGRMVLVHSTAPLMIDGTRKTLPAGLHFAVLAHLVNRPATPRLLVAFHRIERAVRIAPIGRIGTTSIVRGMPVMRGAYPIVRRMPVVIERRPIVIMPPVRAPMFIPRAPVRPMPIMPAPMPMPRPMKPIPPV